MRNPQETVQYVAYDLATGEITQSGSCPREVYEHQVRNAGPDGPGYLEQAGDHEADVVDLATLKVVEKPPLRVTLSRDGKVIQGCPIPCWAWIEGKSYEIDDGSIELSFSLPGRYVIEIVSRITRPGKVTVNWHG